MTKDEVIALAREAAFHTPVQEAELLRFAALVAKTERDRICEMLRERHKQEDRHNYYGFIANMIEEQKWMT
jgi:ribonuclease HII